MKYLLVPLLALLSGCAVVRIGQINADPSRYANRSVSVNGRVTNSVGVLGTGGYQITAPRERVNLGEIHFHRPRRIDEEAAGLAI